MGYYTRENNTMGRRHYIKAAEMIRAMPPADRPAAIALFAGFFADDNSDFDRERFEAACADGDMVTSSRKSFDIKVRRAETHPAVNVAAQVVKRRGGRSRKAATQ